MILHLDTSDNLKTVIKLDDHKFVTSYSSPRGQDVIGALTNALTASNLSLTDLSAITVNLGPGSFTGLRVGIAIAQALGFALDISVNNQPPGTSFSPHYGAPPSITKPSKNND